MKVLLSIKPEFVEKIFSGEKRFEYRKAVFKKSVSTVVVYATMPIGKIVGEFQVGEVLHGSPEDVWEKTKSYAGISKDFYSDYFRDRSKSYAIEVLHVERYKKAIDPIVAGVATPPQSFCYLAE